MRLEMCAVTTSTNAPGNVHAPGNVRAPGSVFFCGDDESTPEGWMTLRPRLSSAAQEVSDAKPTTPIWRSPVEAAEASAVTESDWPTPASGLADVAERATKNGEYLVP